MATMDETYDVTDPTPEALMEAVLAACEQRYMLMEREPTAGMRKSYTDQMAQRRKILEDAILLYGLQMRAAGLRSAETPCPTPPFCTEWYEYEANHYLAHINWHRQKMLAEVERQIQEAAHG